MTTRLPKFALIVIAIVISFVCRGQSKSSEFIFLNAEQLRHLGVDLSENGLFYLNCHRVLQRRSFIGLHPCLYISLRDSIWSRGWPIAERARILSEENKASNHNFFPQVITTPQGCRLIGREDIDRRLIPIAVALSEANLTAHEDTIIFWFTLTDPLVSALPEDLRNNLRWRNYLRVPYINTTFRSDDIIDQADTPPEFPGGIDALQRFLQQNLRFPAIARKAGIQGTVYVTFVVELDGKITNVRVLRGIGGGADEEAIRVVQMMPRWTPGRHGGKLVRAQFNMPIRFLLTG